MQNIRNSSFRLTRQTHHTMEGAALEAEARLSGAELPEVLRSLRDDVGPELEGDSAQLLTACAQVKVDPG